ncbi:MAG: hypothetical protein WCQ50_00820 [Spirochaetota bacterium]
MVQDAFGGEEAIITRHGKPGVRLVPVDAAPDSREPGFFAGKVRMAPDFEATPDEFEDNACRVRLLDPT